MSTNPIADPRRVTWRSAASSSTASPTAPSWNVPRPSATSSGARSGGAGDRPVAYGRGLAAALALGASGVAMGTRFLTSTKMTIGQVLRVGDDRLPAVGLHPGKGELGHVPDSHTGAVAGAQTPPR